MNHIEKERLIKADIASIENRVRHAFNQGYDLGFKDGKSKQPNCSEIPTGSTTKNCRTCRNFGSHHGICEICKDNKCWTEKEPTTKNDLGVDAISRVQTQTEIEMNASRYTIAKERGGMGQVEWSDQLIKVSNAVDIIRHMPSVTSQEPRWIPVSERLPNWDTQCLVIDGDGGCGVGYYREDAHAWDSPNWGWLERKDRVDNKEAFTEPCGIGKVVAWMPLSKPYEPQESEEQE